MRTTHSLRRLLALQLLVATLAACGGGGGGGGQPSPPTPPSPDRTPNSFSFAPIDGAQEGTLVESTAVAITGFDTATSISVSGGEYSLAGGSFTSSPGTISPGQTVRLRVAASASEDTTVRATLTIGGVSGTFDVKSADRTPSDFAFAPVDRAALGAAVESAPIAITGFDASTSIEISGGEYSVAGAPFTSIPGTILPDENVAVRVMAADTPDSAVEATVTVGGVSATFYATTIDTIPDAFAFVPAVDVPRVSNVLSNAVTITGIDVPTPISVTGGIYSINGALFTAAAGEIVAGQTVRLRVTASPTPGGSVEAVVTIGETLTTWKVTTSPDVEPPTASIVYPPPVSRTSARQITVRGTASDSESAILFVRVNGISAVSDDGFATWTATRQLAPGSNTLVIEVGDTKLNVKSSAATATVKREPMFANVSGLSYDAVNRRLIVADPNAAALFAVNPTTGLRSVLSNPLTPNSDTVFPWLYDVAVDAARNRALAVTDSSVVAADLTTGERSFIATNLSATGTLRSIAVDAASNRAFVVDSTGPRILAIDLAGGFVSVLSEPTMPDPLDSFTASNDAAVDAANGRLLVYDSSVPAIYAIDLSTGARSIFSSNTVPNAVNPFAGLAGLAIDTANQRAVVTQGISDSVLVVDLSTGARTLQSSPSVPDAVSPFARPRHIAVDADNGRAFVFDEQTRNVQAMDLSSGERTLVSAQEPASSGPRLPQPRGLVHDPDSGTLLIANSTPPAVVLLDLGTSTRTTLSDNVTPDPFNAFGTLHDIELDAAKDLVLVSDASDKVFRVSRSDGARAVLSSNAFPDALNPFGEPGGLAIDPPNNRLLVSDSGLPGVIAVDLTSGVRTIVSTNAAPAGAPDFMFPSDLVLDTANNRAVVTSFGAALSVSLSNGSRSIFSSSSVPQSGNPLASPRAIAWDAPRNRFIVSDAGTGGGFRVVAVDAATGQATQLSPLPDTLTVNRLPQADGIAVDSDTEIAYVTDWPLGVVVAVDLKTGERSFLTH